MIRGLLKLVVIVIVIVAAGMFFLGWNLSRGRDVDVNAERTGEAVGAAGSEAAAETREAGQDAAGKGREIGAAAGERAGEAAEATQRAVSNGSVTAKIKAKMALDETVKALNLDVDTVAGVVTLKGVVGSEGERQRALQLARETEGVKQVIDQLSVR